MFGSQWRINMTGFPPPPPPPTIAQARDIAITEFFKELTTLVRLIRLELERKLEDELAKRPPSNPFN